MSTLKRLGAAGGVLVVGCFAVLIVSGALAKPARLPRAALASLPAGGPVPAHSSATSVTFVSTQTAYVLGTAPCAHRPCTEILRTRNRGGSWVGLAAPHERVSRTNGNGLWGLRFASARHGFAYGNGLWETTNGGASWRSVAAPARFVVDLAVAGGGGVVALAAPCRAGTNGCSGRLTVYRRSLSGGSWRAIVTTNGAAFDESIAVHGSTVWVLAETQLWISTNGGRSFRSHGQPCAKKAIALPGLTSVADAGAHSYLLCTGQAALGHTVKFVYRTTGTHAAWSFQSKPPTPGDAGSLAAGSDQAIVIATASAASWLYLSRDSGRHWSTPLTFLDGGEGWGDLGFTTASDGVVIHGPAQTDGGSANFPGQLELTSDGGRTWHTAPL
jgi:hypothetical protein